jgi:lysozyme
MRLRFWFALLVLVVGLVAGLGLSLGWWRSNHPDADRFSIWGLDVSHHQGAIDWLTVAKDPRLRFAFIKATEGGDFRDTRFAENWRAAKAAGLRVGAYHFFTFCTDPVLQARNFLGVVPNEPDALPPAIDLEFGGNCQNRKTPEEVRRDVLLLAAALERGTGKKPVLYVTGQAFWTFVDRSEVPLPLWFRDLWAEPKHPTWLFWQFANREQVDGITGPVDMNVFRGDETAWREL